MTYLKICCLTLLVTGALATSGAASGAPDSSADARARATLRQMTPDERLTLLQGYQPHQMLPAERPQGLPLGAGFVRGVPRLGVPPLVESDASLGIANIGGFMRNNDVATALPSGAAMASTWDPQLIEQAGAVIGQEVRAKGFNVLLAGGVNLVREPRNGRNFEYLGEDPLLAGVLAGHAIRGIQSNQVMSTIKHYVLNAQETGRTELSANIDEAALRESDLLAFEIAIEIGDPASVMCGYNQINGVYACENSFLLNDVLRRDWGYKGFVMSDWGAVHSLSLRLGLDQESGVRLNKPAFFGPKLREALAAGQVSQADVDRAALRILRAMYAHGLVDNPSKPGQPIDYEVHGLKAQEVAEAGAVLLKNEGLLPLAASAKRILVVGGHADIGVPGGGGSSQVWPVGGAALSLPVPGEPIYVRSLYMPSSPLAALRKALPNAAITYDDGADPARAVGAARDADLVIVFAEQYTTESRDVASLDLPDGQDGLIASIADANSKTVVVLETGGPVLTPWLDKVGAVLEAWYPGQRGGDAIARVLTGEVNPSGHLPVTFPASLEQLPNPKLPGSDLAKAQGGSDPYDVGGGARHFPVVYPEGADVGYRWYARKGLRPLFAFGHGLSYTRFAYDELKIAGGKELSVSFRVTNVGPRAGAEVAQVYAQVDDVKRLVGWSRVMLAPGERRRVVVRAEPRTLARFDARARSWKVGGGTYRIEVGAASDAPRLFGQANLVARRLKP